MSIGKSSIKLFKVYSNRFSIKNMFFSLHLAKILYFLVLLWTPTRSQVISFGMRKIAYSSNQFGLDLLRASDRSEARIAFCPFCVSSSLVMLMVGTGNGPMSNSLRHALYLYGMNDNEINFAYNDMMNHLGVNLPSSKGNVNGRYYHHHPHSHSYMSGNKFSSSSTSASSVSSPSSIFVNPSSSFWSSSLTPKIPFPPDVAVHSHSFRPPETSFNQLQYPQSYYNYERTSPTQSIPQYVPYAPLPSAGSSSLGLSSSSFSSSSSFQSPLDFNSLNPNLSSRTILSDSFTNNIRHPSASLFVYDNPLAAPAGRPSSSQSLPLLSASAFDLSPPSYTEPNNRLGRSLIDSHSISANPFVEPIHYGSYLSSPPTQSLEFDTLPSSEMIAASTSSEKLSSDPIVSSSYPYNYANAFGSNTIIPLSASLSSSSSSSASSPTARGFGSGFFSTRRNPVITSNNPSSLPISSSPLSSTTNAQTNAGNRPLFVQPSYSGLFVNRRPLTTSSTNPLSPSSNYQHGPHHHHHHHHHHPLQRPANNRPVPVSMQKLQIRPVHSHPTTSTSSSSLSSAINNNINKATLTATQTHPPVQLNAAGQQVKVTHNTTIHLSPSMTNPMLASKPIATHTNQTATLLFSPTNAVKPSSASIGEPAPMLSTLFSSNTSETDSNGSSDICFLSNMYVQRDFVINYHYHLLLQKFYKTAIHPLDFVHNGEETRQHINAIVQMQTDNKIHNILDSRPSPATQLLLISALYFNGQLDLAPIGSTTAAARTNETYNPNNLGSASAESIESLMDLNSRSSALNSVPTSNSIPNWGWMQSSYTRLRYSYNRYLNCTTVEMPLKGALVSFVIMMPNEATGLETLLTKLNAQMLNDVINTLEIRRMSIKVIVFCCKDQ